MRGEKGRTYRYSPAVPLYPFGFGLSYTRFDYRDLSITPQADGIDVTVAVENVGKRAGDEVVQLYVSGANTPTAPIRHLEGFRRIHLAAGEAQTVAFHLTRDQLSVVNEAGERVLIPGTFTIWVGGGQPETGAPGAAGQTGFP
jgi:beta-glucosidase